MSLADLQPTIQKAVFRNSFDESKIVEARGFLHPEVKGLFLHVLEKPFTVSGHNLCSVVHIQSYLAIAKSVTFTQAYELMLLLKHLDWQRSGEEIKKDKETQTQTRIITKRFFDDLAFDEVRL